MEITVRELVTETAQSLGFARDVADYLIGEPSGIGEEVTKLLLKCFERVENELALDYLPLLAQDEVVSGNGVVEYAALQKPAARILCVENEWGESLKYKLFPTYLQTEAGKIKIVYAYAPSAQTIDGRSEYTTLVSKRLLVYGMAAEYCLAVGELAEAKVWDKKYKDGVQAAYKVSPCKRLRSRRWV